MKIKIQSVKQSFAFINAIPTAFTMALLLLFVGNIQATTEPVQSIRIVMPTKIGQVAKRASELLAREISERSNVNVVTAGKAILTIELYVKKDIGIEGYEITDSKNGSIKITGNDENGLLYGVGKFLHTSSYSQVDFTPSPWRGTSVPKCPVRGMHMDTHFNNFYEGSNDAERKRYIEDMALWGENVLIVLFPSPWLKGFDDPVAKASLRRMNQMMLDAKAVGMKVGIAFGNDLGFEDTPKELRATGGDLIWGDVLLCPNKHAAMDMMKKHLSRLLDELSGPGVDYVMYWPYDEGGCTCEKCFPWGANGYPNMCREFTAVTRSKYPKVKFILGTWLFDAISNVKDWPTPLKMDGEYAGLDKFLQKDKSWVDYLIVDAHENFPEYPLKVGAPGGLPMLNFPEISMWEQYPWGGYGANPLPGRFQVLWNQAKEKLSGGIPYSEGIFDDFNKTICMQLYWSPDRSTIETVKEYINYEFGSSVVEPVSKVVQLLEQNHNRKLVVENKVSPTGDLFLFGLFKEGSRLEFLNTDGSTLSNEEFAKRSQNVEEAYRLISHADSQLTPYVRSSWRWRILYLRALIDHEFLRTNGWFEGPILKMAFEELTRIYHTEKACIMLQVPRIDDPYIKYSNK